MGWGEPELGRLYLAGWRAQLRQRSQSKAQQQQDTWAHIDGPRVVRVEDQGVGAGAVGGHYEVLEPEHPGKECVKRDWMGQWEGGRDEWEGLTLPRCQWEAAAAVQRASGRDRGR